MGDAQSVQKRDAAEMEAEAEEERMRSANRLTDERTHSSTGHICGKGDGGDGSAVELNGLCEDQVAAEVVEIVKGDAAGGTEHEDHQESPKDLEELVQKLDGKEERYQCDPTEEAGVADVLVKQNSINESLRRFFSSVAFKLTVKKVGENVENSPDALFETKTDKQSAADAVEDAAELSQGGDNNEQSTEVHTAKETCDMDSTTCPTLTEDSPEDLWENVEQTNLKAKDALEDMTSRDQSPIMSPQDAEEGNKPEEESRIDSPSSQEEEVVMSPFKRFFTTGIFSAFRRKIKSATDENIEKNLTDSHEEQTGTNKEYNEAKQQQETEETSPKDVADPTQIEQRPSGEETSATAPSTSTDTPAARNEDVGDTSPPLEPPVIVNNETEGSQERMKVQGSPLKRLLSGSSFKRLSKKQRGRRSSDSKLSDSGEQASDQQLSSSESTENHREESPTQPTDEAAEVEGESPWASFKKFMTPQKRAKTLSKTNEDQPAEEPRTSEGEQGSDRSTEEGRKRKDSAVSWEAVLCGSGRRRSRKTSDTEDEEVPGTKDGEPGMESSTGLNNVASFPTHTAGPSDRDGGSTWNSLKRLVTPKRKGKDEEVGKDAQVQSGGETTKYESSFSIKKLIPRRRKKKEAQKPDQLSSDEADREAASEDEDSDTPAVVPLSEFEVVIMDIPTETTHVAVESHVDPGPAEDNLAHMTETLLPEGGLQAEDKKMPDNSKPLVHQTPQLTGSAKEAQDLTDSSNYQQLSDIPEEGVIEETMATPASFADEAARDDTIAEDLIEMTSEAFTALEPIDTPLTDETEMMSAVSQLTESSKTSGNTTPVPAEHSTKATDVLLHQVVETISTTPTSTSLSLTDMSSEKIASIVSPQVFDVNVKHEATLLERHRQSEATSTETGLHVEEMDHVNEHVAARQTESKGEIEKAISTEVLPVTMHTIITTKITVDEVHHEVDASQAQQFTERNEESQLLVECLPEEGAEAEPMDKEKSSPVDISTVELNEDQICSHSGEPEDESKPAAERDEAIEDHEKQEVPADFEIVDQSRQVMTHQGQSGDEEHVPLEAEDKPVSPYEKEAVVKTQECNSDIQKQSSAHESSCMEAVVTNPDESHTQEVGEDSYKAETYEVEAEEHIAEAVDDLQPLIPVHIPVVNEEPESIQVLEKKLVSLVDIAPCVETASLSSDKGPISRAHLTVAAVTTCDMQEAAAAAQADVATAEAPETTEPVIETVTCEVDDREIVEVVTSNLGITTETAEESVVAMNYVPAEEFEDDRRIQVQEVGVYIESAEANVSAVLKVSVKLASEVAFDCHSDDKTVKTGSPTSEDKKEETTGGSIEAISKIPEPALEEASEMPEPVGEALVCTSQLQETETVTPLQKMEMMAEKEESESMVVMMNLPSVQLEENNRIEVQVVNVDVRSAGRSIDAVLEVGLIQGKEVTDVCHQMDDTGEELSTTLATEEGVMIEKSQVSINKETHQFKESLAGTATQTVQQMSTQTVQETQAGTSPPTVQEAVADKSSQTVQETLAEMSHQKVQETLAETSLQTVQRTLTETSSQRVQGTLADTSPHMVQETLAETPPQTEQETLAETSPEREQQTTTQTSTQRVQETPAETSPQTVQETLAQTSPQTIQETLSETSPKMVQETFAETSPETVQEELAETSPKTVQQTLAETSLQMLQETLAETSPKMVQETLAETSPKTAQATLAGTSSQTLQTTLAETPSQTVQQTSKETAPQTVQETTTETSPQMVQETLADTSTQTARESLAETTPKTVQETLVETSPKTEQETTTETSPRIVQETLAEMPPQVVLDTLAEVPPQTVQDTLVEMSSQMVQRTLAEMSSQMVQETLTETSSQKVQETLADIVPQTSAEMLQDTLSMMLPKSIALQTTIQDEVVDREIEPPKAYKEQSQMTQSQFVGSQDCADKSNGALNVESSVYGGKQQLEESEVDLTKRGVTTDDLTSGEPKTTTRDGDMVDAQQLQNATNHLTSNITGSMTSESSAGIPPLDDMEALASSLSMSPVNVKFGHSNYLSSSSSAQVQVCEPLESEQQINTTQKMDAEQQAESPNVNLQVAQTVEPETDCEEQTTATITSLLDQFEVGIQSVEAVEPVDKIQAVEKVTLSLEATPVRQPLRQIDARMTSVVLSHPELITEEAPEAIKLMVEEYQQEVWQDAEEHSITKEDKETVKRPESQTETEACVEKWRPVNNSQTPEKQGGDGLAATYEHLESAAKYYDD